MFSHNIANRNYFGKLPLNLVPLTSLHGAPKSGNEKAKRDIFKAKMNAALILILPWQKLMGLDT